MDAGTYRVSVIVSNGRAQSATLQRQEGAGADTGWPIWENVRPLRVDEQGTITVEGEPFDTIAKGVDQIIDLCNSAMKKGS